MPRSFPAGLVVLAPQQWHARARAHHERIAAYTRPLKELHSAGVRHPVYDFLFSYYSLTPGALQRWHPGAGVVLAADPDAGPDPDAQPGPVAGRDGDDGPAILPAEPRRPGCAADPRAGQDAHGQRVPRVARPP